MFPLYRGKPICQRSRSMARSMLPMACLMALVLVLQLHMVALVVCLCCADLVTLSPA